MGNKIPSPREPRKARKPQLVVVMIENHHGAKLPRKGQKKAPVRLAERFKAKAATLPRRKRHG